MTIQLNGYTIEITQIHNKEASRFITLIDEQGKHHYFSMIKPDGEWIIRNPVTVPSFILEIEKDISKIM